MKSDKKHTLISFLIFGTITAIFVLGYNLRGNIKIPEMLRSLVDGTQSSGRYVKTDLVSQIGGKNLRIKLLIPCADLRQQIEIMEKIPRIKHSFMQSAGHPDFATAFNRRDFQEIKGYLLKVVNNVSDRAVENVYFENFFYD